MPLQLTTISRPAGADHEDLLKLYADWPEPIADVDNWLDQRLAAGDVLFAGRFNGRLVAAVWGHRAARGLELDHLCVRQVTRRRGVARQLLLLLCRRADAEGLALTMRRDPLSDPLAPLLQELGFSAAGECWQRGPQA